MENEIKFLDLDFDPVTHERFLMVKVNQEGLDKLLAGEIVEVENQVAEFAEKT